MKISLSKMRPKVNKDHMGQGRPPPSTTHVVLIKLFTLTLAGETGWIGWAFGFSSQIGSGNDDEFYGNLWHPMTFASMTVTSFWLAGTGEIEDVRLKNLRRFHEIYIVSRL